MPTVGRDQINAGETIDPVFDATEEAATAEGGTAEGGTADAGQATNGYEEQDVGIPEGAEGATADPPRMDDLVEEDPQLRGLDRRIDALTDNDVELPDQARRNAGSPGRGRGDDDAEPPFEAPRSWSDAGAAHAADAAAGAGPAGELRDDATGERVPGGGSSAGETNGTQHPSDVHRQDEDDDAVDLDPVLGRPIEEPDESGSGPGLGGGIPDEHRGGGRHGGESGDDGESGFDEGPSAG